MIGHAIINVCYCDQLCAAHFSNISRASNVNIGGSGATKTISACKSLQPVGSEPRTAIVNEDFEKCILWSEAVSNSQTIKLKIDRIDTQASRGMFGIWLVNDEGWPSPPESPRNSSSDRHIRYFFLPSTAMQSKFLQAMVRNFGGEPLTIPKVSPPKGS